MKKSIYILVVLLGFSFCLNCTGEKKGRGGLHEISFNNSKADLKRTTSVYCYSTFRASKINVPFKTRKVRGLKGSHILLSSVLSVNPTYAENKFVSFTSQYYYFRLFDANGKRGPPSQLSTT